VYNLERNWLVNVPWQRVVETNQELCLKDQDKNAPHGVNPQGFEAAARLWAAATGRTMRLRDVLDVFRQVHKLAPFKFFNGNTVAALAKTMISEVLNGLPPVQTTMAQRTVSHYVVGMIKAGEMQDVLGHIGEAWRKLPPGPATPGGVPGQPMPRA
jgi:hypothetical protein